MAPKRDPHRKKRWQPQGTAGLASPDGQCRPPGGWRV